VCDREILVFVKFTRNFPKTLKHKERVKFEWIPIKYPPFREDSDSKFLSLIAFSLKVFLHPDPEVEYQNTQQKELN